MSRIPVENKGNSSGSTSSCCASSRFSCVNDLGHKPVTFSTCQQQQGGNGGGGKQRCLWFSKDYNQPIFAMHSNCYLNSECFIIDTEISVLRILPVYKLVLCKEHIHVLEDEQTRFSFKFKDGSDSFAVWIQLCTYQNVEPFTANSVMLTKSSIPVDNHLLLFSSSNSTLESSWLTMKFKTGNNSSNWFTFAKMQIVSITFRKWQYVVLLLKSDDPNDEAPTGLFCIRPGVTCLKTTSQLYYEPCDDSSGRKYILDFDNEMLCSKIWNLVKMVTPLDFSFGNNLHLPYASIVEPQSKKAQRTQSHLETQRNRRLKLIYRCFAQMQQEVQEIMKCSKSNLQEMIDLPEIHIAKLFFSVPTWMERCRNIRDKFTTIKFMSAENLRKEITASFVLQCTNVSLHIDIIKMLMKEGVPAELIAEYRETLAKRMATGNYAGRCRRIHCIFN